MEWIELAPQALNNLTGCPRPERLNRNFKKISEGFAARHRSLATPLAP